MRAWLLVLAVVVGPFAAAGYQARTPAHGFRVGDHFIDATVVQAEDQVVFVRLDDHLGPDAVLLLPEEYDDFRRHGAREANRRRMARAQAQRRGQSEPSPHMAGY